MPAARELDVYGLVEGETVDVNLAHGTCSSVDGVQNPTNANDDDVATFVQRVNFASDVATYFHDLTTDLGAAFSVNQMRLLLNETADAAMWPALDGSDVSGARTNTGKVYWSDNGTDWTEFSGDITETRDTAPIPSVITYDFAALTHRWWRVAISTVFTGLGTAGARRIGTLEILGGAGEELTFLGTLTSAFDVSYRDELDGHGAGKFSIPKYDDPETGTANPEVSTAMLGDGIDVTRLIKVRQRKSDATYSIVGAFWLETGDFSL